MYGALITTTVLLMAGPIQAQETNNRVSCEIHVIHAEKGANHIDTQLKSMSRYLTRAFGNRFQSFKQVKKGQYELNLKKSNSTKLPNGTQLKLTNLGTEKGMLRLAMEISGLKTTIKVRDGGLFFQAGRKYKKGMIIVAIRARKVASKR